MQYLEETIKSNQSVRQLERQINSFYYERLLPTSEEHKEEVKDEINILEKKEKVQEDNYGIIYQHSQQKKIKNLYMA